MEDECGVLTMKKPTVRQALENMVIQERNKISAVDSQLAELKLQRANASDALEAYRDALARPAKRTIHGGGVLNDGKRNEA